MLNRVFVKLVLLCNAKIKPNTEEELRNINTFILHHLTVAMDALVGDVQGTMKLVAVVYL